jgi:hypothetical protein
MIGMGESGLPNNAENHNKTIYGRGRKHKL